MNLTSGRSIVLALALAACGGAKPPAQTTLPVGDAPPTADTPPESPPPAPGYGQPGAPASAGGAATALAPAAAAAAAPALMGLAATEAPGMHPDGAVFAGQFATGQTLEQPIDLQPGACYTVVGVGMGVTDLGLQLVAQPAPMLPSTVLAQSFGAGPTATIGGKAEGCFKNPLPISSPAKIIILARQGAGMAAAQVFVK